MLYPERVPMRRPNTTPTATMVDDAKYGRMYTPNIAVPTAVPTALKIMPDVLYAPRKRPGDKTGDDADDRADARCVYDP